MKKPADRLSRPSVYLHVPICKSKCPYCDFTSIAVDRSEQTAEMEDAYRDAVIEELKQVSRDRNILPAGQSPRSVYFGGGTPSLLSPGFYESVLTATQDALGSLGTLSEAEITPEITIEANPDSMDLEKLKGYRRAGINRISIGIQSLNDRDLKVLGRPHTAREATTAFKAARKAGFENISIDLIFAVPGQSLKDWEDVLKEAALLEAEHVSIYGLTIEPGTPFMAAKERGDIKPSPEDLEIEMYETAVGLLTDSGHARYEISNFALPGKESRHNSGYWLGRDYIGLGAGAHSYVSTPGFGRRYWNISDPTKYMELKGKGAKAGEEILGRVEAMTEAVMLSLRLTSGIDIEAFKGRFGLTPMEVLDYKKLLDLKTLVVLEGRLRLTDKGIRLSNEIFKTISP